MKRSLITAIVTLSILAAAAPAPASAAEDRNLRFILDGLGLDAVPEGTAEVHRNGVVTTMPIADALGLAVARAGGVDLAALAASASDPSGLLDGGPFGVGDVWVLEFSEGGCQAPEIIVASPVPSTGFHEQGFTYGGAFGRTESTGGIGVIIDWTTKGLTGGGYYGSVHIKGQSDFFCLYFFGFTLFFPYVNGIAWTD